MIRYLDMASGAAQGTAQAAAQGAAQSVAQGGLFLAWAGAHMLPGAGRPWERRIQQKSLSWQGRVRAKVRGRGRGRGRGRVS